MYADSRVILLPIAFYFEALTRFAKYDAACKICPVPLFDRQLNR